MRRSETVTPKFIGKQTRQGLIAVDQQYPILRYALVHHAPPMHRYHHLPQAYPVNLAATLHGVSEHVRHERIPDQ